MELMSLDCPRCGAHLPPRDPVGQLRCEYCGAMFGADQVRAVRNASGQPIDPRHLAQLIAQELGAQRRPPPGPPPPMPVNYHSPYAAGPAPMVQVHRSRGRGLMWMIIMFSTCVPVGVGLVSSGALSGIEGLGDLADMGRTERLLYDAHAGPPSLTTIGGRPALVGRTRVVYPEDKLFIDAYDAQTAERIWRIGPLGTYSDAYQKTHAAVAGDKVVVSHADATVTVRDLLTGNLVSSHPLTDTVEQMCASPADAGPPRVFLRKIDEKHLMLDPSAGKLVEADAPSWCPHHWSDAEKLRPDYAESELAPTVDGFEPKHVHRDGKLAVAAGVKSPGTAVPRAVGFDPATKKVLWEADVFAVDRTSVRANSMEFGALRDGKFFTVYGSGTDAWHVTALDAKTGKRIWHVDCRGIFAVDSINGVWAGEGAVYVERTSSMEIYDAKTGALRGTIGFETYD